MFNTHALPHRFFAPLLLCLLLPGLSLSGQISSKQFEDYSIRAGLIYGDDFSWGSSWSDGNGDGFPDLFVSNHFQERSNNPPALYFSGPEGVFSREAVPNYLNTADMHGAGWFDFDNDGDQDLMITTGRANRNSFLINNGTGHFVERAVELGADFPFCRGRTPLYLDQNRDGLLDILVSAGPILMPTQLPTSLAMRNPSCDPTCFSLVGPDSAGMLTDLSSTEALLIDPDGDDQLNPMIVTLSLQPWAAVGCLPFQTIGATTISNTNEVVGGDLNGDMVQDLLYIRNRLDQSYVENPFPVNYLFLSRVGKIAPPSVSVSIEPVHGISGVLPGGILRYVPEADYTGPDSLIVRYCDSTGRCNNSTLRFIISDLPVADSLLTLLPSTFNVAKNGAFFLSIPDYIQPYNHRLRANLSVKSSANFFRFRTLSDSIFIVSDEGPFESDAVFIGQSGYHPQPGQSFLLRSSDTINHGMPAAGAGSRVVIAYNTSDHSWTLGLQSEDPSTQILSVFCPKPMKVTRYMNFDSLPEVSSNTLLIRDGLRYRDATVASGLYKPAESFSATLGDFDNDMDLDIYESYGILGRNVPNVLWENNGLGQFQLAPKAGGAEGTRRGAAGTVSMADYNRDGFLDLLLDNGRDLELQGPYQLFRNNGNQNRWLGFKLRGTQSNRDGIGAVVRVYAGGKGQIRFADGGFHRYVQNDPILHFGLGPNKVADSVTVRWPSGARSVLTNVLSNQYLEVVEPLTGGWACFPPAQTSGRVDPSLGAVLNWIPVDCAQGYEVAIQEEGDLGWNILTSDNSTLVIPFTGLEENRTYNWTVRAVCASGTKGAYSKQNSFSTEINCSAPQNPVTRVIAADSIILAWDRVPSAQTYIVYRLSEGATSYDSVAAATNRLFLLPGLVDSLPFSWYVKAACPFNQRSEPSETVFYFAESTRNAGSSDCRLQPNPAQTAVQLLGLSTRANFRISDLSGREWSSGETEPGQAISLSGLPAGAYLLSWQPAVGGNWQSLPLQVR